MTDASGEPGLVRGGSLFRFMGQGPPNHPRAMNPPPPAWNAHPHAHASHVQTQQGQPRSQARVSAGLSAGPFAGLYSPPAVQSVHHATPQRKASLTGAFQSPVTLQGTQEWCERSAVASEKGKAIFGAVNRVFQSSDWGLSDVQSLLSIHLEQPVRSLDRLAAHQALKAAAVQERQWSTEPNGQGFRMTGREAKGYIDRNNIDPTRLLFSASDEGIPESRSAQSIAEESSSELQKAALLRQAAKEAASLVGIPLYTDLDNFVEQAEQQYAGGSLPVEDERAVSAGQQQQEGAAVHPAGAMQPPQHPLSQHASQHQSPHALYVPQHSPLGVQAGQPALPTQPAQPAHLGLSAHLGTSAHQPHAIPLNHGPGELPPIIVKDANLMSTGTFDRRSQSTWNDMSPRFYDGGVLNLPWAGQEEMMVSGPTMATTAAMEDFNSPIEGVLAKATGASRSSGSTKEGDGRGTGAVGAALGTAMGTTVGTAVGGMPGNRPGDELVAAMRPPQADGHTMPTPLCFCGTVCERSTTPGGAVYYGCKASKCGAQIPVSPGAPGFAHPRGAGDDSRVLANLVSQMADNTTNKAQKRKRDAKASPAKASKAAKAPRARAAANKAAREATREAVEAKESKHLKELPIRTRREDIQDERDANAARDGGMNDDDHDEDNDELVSVAAKKGANAKAKGNASKKATKGKQAKLAATSEDTERTEFAEPAEPSQGGRGGKAATTATTVTTATTAGKASKWTKSPKSAKFTQATTNDTRQPARAAAVRAADQLLADAARGLADLGTASKDNQVLETEHLIAQELSAIPPEMRCKKRDPSKGGRKCLRSLRLGPQGPLGHLGRCRYAPKKPERPKRVVHGVSDASGTSTSNISSRATYVTDAQPAPRRAAGSSLGPTRKGSSPVDNAPRSRNKLGPTGKPGARSTAIAVKPKGTAPTVGVEPAPAPDATSDENVNSDDSAGNGATDANTDPAAATAAAAAASDAVAAATIAAQAARAASKKRLDEAVASGKRHADGRELMRREFAELSASSIHSAYGCSALMPHVVWHQQKQTFESQCEVLQAHPLLHAETVGKTNISAVAGTRTLVVDGKPLPHMTWSEIAAQEGANGNAPACREQVSGLFAATAFSAGHVVAELLGEFISAAEAECRKREYTAMIEGGSGVDDAGLRLVNAIGEDRGRLARAGDMMFALNKDWAIDTTRAGSSARFARRAKDGNCRLEAVRDPSGAVHLFLQAVTPLESGDEITIRERDYDPGPAVGF